MTTRQAPLNVSPMTVAAFEHLLDLHGADRDRWPFALRAGAVQLLGESAAARQLLAEAVAFEAVLARGTEVEGNTAALAALTDRIVGAAVAGPRLASVAAVPAAVSGSQRSGRKNADWRRGAALMAASLIIGVFAGQSQIAVNAVPKLAALAGLSLSGNDQMAQADLDIDAPELD